MYVLLVASSSSGFFGGLAILEKKKPKAFHWKVSIALRLAPSKMKKSTPVPVLYASKAID